jgi:hypothetical protein
MNLTNFLRIKQMEPINELAKALAVAQSKMEGAAKDTSNPFFKSKYADLSSVTSAVRSGLDGTGLSYVQFVHDKPECAAIETLILHSSGQSLSTGIVCVPVAKHDAQGYGSAITYARRYGLAMAFGVAPEDDDGNAANKSPPPRSTKPTGNAARIEFEALPEGKKYTIRDYVTALGEHTERKDFASAFDLLQSFNLDSDDKVYLWSQLDSATRTAFTALSKRKTEEE